VDERKQVDKVEEWYRPMWNFLTQGELPTTRRQGRLSECRLCTRNSTICCTERDSRSR